MLQTGIKIAIND